MGYAESRDSFSTLVQQAVAEGPGHNSLAPAADPVAAVSTRLRILAASSLEHFVSAQLVAFFPSDPLLSSWGQLPAARGSLSALSGRRGLRR